MCTFRRVKSLKSVYSPLDNIEYEAYYQSTKSYSCYGYGCELDSFYPPFILCFVARCRQYQYSMINKVDQRHQTY